MTVIGKVTLRLTEPAVTVTVRVDDPRGVVACVLIWTVVAVGSDHMTFEPPPMSGKETVAPLGSPETVMGIDVGEVPLRRVAVTAT
ncbi:MAG TPA: hypothetical protein VMT45_06940 [Thermoanaerobaculaceae bacterium]|nr:hypothetical protein [Thermoanaerobaculaceae bacterium]